MGKRTLTAVAVACALALASGCVGKKMFRENVETQDARSSSVESAVEANERRIADLRGETDSKIAALEGKTSQAVEVGQSAMTEARHASETAERAALGKLLWEVTLSDESVKFSFDRSQVPDEARAQLDSVIDRIKSYGKAVYVEIEGHTDSMGAEEYNWKLGASRATAVRDYLNSGGIPLHAINTISHGESNPIADNNTVEGRSKNRRVVIKVLE